MRRPLRDASGYADVKVINPDGGEGILKDGYYYIAPRTAPLPWGFSAESYDSITIELTWDPSEHADYYEIFASQQTEKIHTNSLKGQNEQDFLLQI